MKINMKKDYIGLKFEDSSNNFRMCYIDSYGKGTPIILLHGGGFTGPINWDKHYEYLSKKLYIIFYRIPHVLVRISLSMGAFYSMKASRTYFLRQ